MAETNGFMEPALFVEPLPENFDPKMIPTDGMQYLQLVRYETVRCEQVVTADIDPRKYDSNRTRSYGTPSIPKVSCKLNPSPEQISNWLDLFKKAQLKVDKIRRTSNVKQGVQTIQMPDLHDSKSWYDICIGTYKKSSDPSNELALVEKLSIGCTLENDYVRKLEVPKVEESNNVLNSEINKNKVGLAPSRLEPTLSLLLHLYQSNITRLLEYHAEWLEEGSTDFQHSGSWIYSLLCALDVPVKSETHAVIRSLARLAIIEKSKMAVQNPNLILLDSLNLLIVIAVKHYSQHDLADF